MSVKVVILPDARALAVAAADAVCAVVRRKPDARLGLPTGGTPIPTYEELRQRESSGDVDFSRGVIYAIDEFAGPSSNTPGTNTAFYEEHLRIHPAALHCPRSDAPDPDAEVQAYATAMRRDGGLDLCLLGIGLNGHVAFNEPGSSSASRAAVVPLAESSRAAYADAFGSLDRVPRLGMTLGIADVLESRVLVVLAQGAEKAVIVRAAIEGPATDAAPASWLRLHADVTWLVDAAAASLLSPRAS